MFKNFKQTSSKNILGKGEEIKLPENNYFNTNSLFKCILIDLKDNTVTESFNFTNFNSNPPQEYEYIYKYSLKTYLTGEDEIKIKEPLIFD